MARAFPRIQFILYYILGIFCAILFFCFEVKNEHMVKWTHSLYNILITHDIVIFVIWQTFRCLERDWLSGIRMIYFAHFTMIHIWRYYDQSHPWFSYNLCFSLDFVSSSRKSNKKNPNNYMNYRTGEYLKARLSPVKPVHWKRNSSLLHNI